MVTQYRLYRRSNGFFYHRVKVPVDLRTHYRKEIEQVSLGTRDPREAVRRLPAIIVEVDQKFSRMRDDYGCGARAQNMDGSANTTPMVSRVDIKSIAADYAKEVDAQEIQTRALIFREAKRDLRSYIRDAGIPPENLDYVEYLEGLGHIEPVLGFIHRMRLKERIAATKAAWSVGNIEEYEAIVDRLLPSIASSDRLTLIKALIDAELKVLDAWQEEPELVPHPGTLLEPVAPSITVAPALGEQGALSDLPLMSVIYRKCFQDVGKEKNWSAKTEFTRHTQIKQFLEICGDRPLNRYTQDDIRLLKDTLRALPPQAHGKKQFKGMTKLQIAEKARELGLEGLSTESVRQIMTSVSIVFGWVRGNYRTSLSNIVQPMIPVASSGGSKRDKRHGFTSEELQKLFASPVFVGVKSEVDWYEGGDVAMSHTGRFWVPLLALFTGVRLMEAVQLVRQDVGCKGDIWFLDINKNDEEETGKRVKNESSLRRIPVHPELIRLGFLEFVKSVSDGARLFPDIAIGPEVQRHRHASKMFNKLLKVAGIKGPKKVWHSLRHSFEQACRDSRVDSAIMDQLQGHSQKGMRATYGKGYGLPELNHGIQSVRYAGLDLSHVQPFAS